MTEMFNEILPEGWLFRVTSLPDGQSVVKVYDHQTRLFNVSIGPVDTRDLIQRHVDRLVNGIQDRAALEKRVTERGARTEDMQVGDLWYKEGMPVRIFAVDSDAGIVKYKPDPDPSISSWNISGPMLETDNVNNWTLY